MGPGKNVTMHVLSGQKFTSSIVPAHTVMINECVCDSVQSGDKIWGGIKKIAGHLLTFSSYLTSESCFMCDIVNI